jgi:hypothetical protein
MTLPIVGSAERDALRVEVYDLILYVDDVEQKCELRAYNNTREGEEPDRTGWPVFFSAPQESGPLGHIRGIYTPDEWSAYKTRLFTFAKAAAEFLLVDVDFQYANGTPAAILEGDS